MSDNWFITLFWFLSGMALAVWVVPTITEKILHNYTPNKFHKFGIWGGYVTTTNYHSVKDVKRILKSTLESLECDLINHNSSPRLIEIDVKVKITPVQAFLLQFQRINKVENSVFSHLSNKIFFYIIKWLYINAVVRLLRSQALEHYK